MFHPLLSTVPGIIPILGLGVGDQIASVPYAMTSFVSIATLVLMAVLILGLEHAGVGQKAVITRGDGCREVHGPCLFCTIPFLERVRLVAIRDDEVAIMVGRAVSLDNVPVQFEGVLSFRGIDEADGRQIAGLHRDRVAARAEEALQTIISGMTAGEFLADRDRIARVIGEQLDEQLCESGLMASGVRIDEIAPDRVA